MITLFEFSSISNNAYVDAITTSVLKISTIESYQYGDYFCNASNKMGNAEARINVFGKSFSKQIIYIYSYLFCLLYFLFYLFYILASDYFVHFPRRPIKI